jgi:5-methylcytosine-specific restriction endonuclease McrA
MSSIHSRKWRKLREEVFKEYGRACAYCGYEDEVMTVDHIIHELNPPKNVSVSHD